MAVAVDANILPQNGDLNSLDIQILVALGRETGQELLVPRMVYEEALSKRRREIEDVFETLRQAHRAARREAAIPVLSDLPSAADLADAYGERLRGVFRVVETPEGAADDALSREAHRRRPAREGRGARDAAIWLTVKAVHASGPPPTYFISDNVTDFGESGGSLAEELRAELQGIEGPFVYCRSVSALLSELAAPEPPFLDLGFLEGTPEVTAAAIGAIQETDVLTALVSPSTLSRAVEPVSLFAAGPIAARPVSASESSGFAIEGRRVSVGWSRWEFRIPVGTLLWGRPGVAQTVEEIGCSASLQLLARVGPGDEVVAQVLAVRGVRPSEDLIL